MLLKSQLVKDKWYRGFHPDFHVAKWDGYYFWTYIGNMPFPFCHTEDNVTNGFEPIEEIEAPPEHLKNNTQLDDEIKSMQDKAKGIIDVP